MNVCIVSTFSCDFEEFKELFDLSNQVIGEWCSEAELIKVNDHKSIMLVDVTDLDKMKKPCRFQKCLSGINKIIV